LLTVCCATLHIIAFSLWHIATMPELDAALQHLSATAS